MPIYQASGTNSQVSAVEIDKGQCCLSRRDRRRLTQCLVEARQLPTHRPTPGLYAPTNRIHIRRIRQQDGPVFGGEVLQIQIWSLITHINTVRAHTLEPTHLIRLREEVAREERDVRLLKARREDYDVRGELRLFAALAWLRVPPTHIDLHPRAHEALRVAPDVSAPPSADMPEELVVHDLMPGRELRNLKRGAGRAYGGGLEEPEMCRREVLDAVVAP